MGGNLAEMWIDLLEIHRFNLSGTPGVALLASRDTRVSGHKPRSLVEARGVLNSTRLQKVMPMLSTTAFPLTQVKYCGRMWPAPRNCHEALGTRFGWNWRTPKLLNRHGTTKNIACQIWRDCDAEELENTWQLAPAMSKK